MTPRPPDAFGWVIHVTYSADYRVEDATVLGRSTPYRVLAGSAQLTLVDGTAVQVTTDTEILWTLCDELRPGSASKPCWLHVGFGQDGEVAEWMLAFDVRSGHGAPEHRTVGINRDVMEVRAESLVLSDGSALPFEASEVAVLCHGGSVDDMLNAYGRDGRLYLVMTT